ncbi:glycohydrolase toxin TNT-related protein [Mycobacterium sp. IS-1496]|uniref:glycohydrolase toxin TNT-related protein n=1 Tax=Mycobacterium sp. IS-1496 TaxID=1772284 RepID=UPI0012FC197C|nr:glycohydrolase toxin TNT-related protein [Mycobacterium sp. IS-1496]
MPFLNVIPGGMFAGAALTWPSGSPGRLRLAARQWENIGTGLSIFDDLLTPMKTVVGQQQIPEGGRIGEALDKLGGAVSKLSTSAGILAEQIDDFARGVEETQNAIRRLLDRISLGGAWDMVKGIFTGEADDILREVANDVGTVLNNFQDQVKGIVGLLGQLTSAIGDAVTSLQEWVRPHLVELLGDDVGNALADVFTLYTDFQVGLTTGLINTVASTVALADPDTWKEMANVALSVARDPSTAPAVLANMGKEFVAWDKWSGDHPGRAAGEAAFNIGSLFVPGGALSKTGTLAKGLRTTRGLLNDGKIPGLRGLGSSDGTPNLDTMPDLESVPSGVPSVPEVRPPGIPESVLSPTMPHGVDGPSAPRGLEGPAGPPNPPGPAAIPGGGGDGPTTHGRGDEPPPPPPGDGPRHPFDSPSPAAPHDAPSHAPSTHESHAPQANQTPAGGGHAEAGTAPPTNTHTGDRAPSHNGSSAVEYNGRADTPADAPTHAPPADQHNGPAVDSNYPAAQTHTPSDGNAGRHDSSSGSAPPPVGMAEVGPMAPHVPGATHAPSATLTPDAPARTPEARGPETRASHTASPETPRAQQASAAGPAPGHTPTAPVTAGASNHTAAAAGQPTPVGSERPGSRPEIGGDRPHESSPPPATLRGHDVPNDSAELVRDYDADGRTIPTNELVHPDAGLLTHDLLADAASNPTRVSDAMSPGLPSSHPEVRDLVPDSYDPMGGMGEDAWKREYWPSGDRDMHGNPDLVWPDSQAHPQGFNTPEGRTPTVLNPGDEFDRFGPGFGQFGSPVGTPFPERALPAHSLDAGYHRYEVVRPLPIWEGKIAPAMGQPGGGTQYYFTQPIVDLLNAGYLREVRL